MYSCIVHVHARSSYTYHTLFSPVNQSGTEKPHVEYPSASSSISHYEVYHINRIFTIIQL